MWLILAAVQGHDRVNSPADGRPADRAHLRHRSIGVGACAGGATHPVGHRREGLPGGLAGWFEEYRATPRLSVWRAIEGRLPRCQPRRGACPGPHDSATGVDGLRWESPHIIGDELNVLAFVHNIHGPRVEEVQILALLDSVQVVAVVGMSPFVPRGLCWNWWRPARRYTRTRGKVPVERSDVSDVVSAQVI